jgi:ferredoxin
LHDFHHFDVILKNNLVLKGEREVSMAKIPHVEQNDCISCGLCVEVAPEVFRLNDQDLSEVYNPSGAPEEKIQEAIDSCPVQCISWEE